MRFVFSTESLEPEARFEAFRDTLVRRLFQLDLVNRPDLPRLGAASRSGQPYFGEVALYVGGPVVFGRVHGSPAEFFRSPELARRCEEGAWVLLTRSGLMRVAQGDVNRLVAPGGGIVFDAVRAHGGQCVVQSDTWVVQVPDAALRTLRARPDKATTLLSPDMALARMMMGVIEAHHRLGAQALPEIDAATAQYLADLVALALGADADGTHVAEGRGLKAARLQAVLDDIGQHYTDAAIGAAAVAMRVGVTPRYVHLLLEETGRTFSDHVLGHRLALARRLIQDPRGNARKISDVAFSCGFNDLSYFDRTFRQRFGMTPSDLRASAAAALQRRETDGGTRGTRRRRRADAGRRSAMAAWETHDLGQCRACPMIGRLPYLP